jgi:hypothetical protein
VRGEQQAALTCTNHLKQLAAALALYYDENGDYPPVLQPSLRPGERFTNWEDSLLPLVGFVCGPLPLAGTGEDGRQDCEHDPEAGTHLSFREIGDVYAQRGRAVAFLGIGVRRGQDAAGLGTERLVLVVEAMVSPIAGLSVSQIGEDHAPRPEVYLSDVALESPHRRWQEPEEESQRTETACQPPTCRR